MAAAARIRAATPKDARPVAEVHVTSWRHTYRGLVPDDYLDRLSVDDRESMWLGASPTRSEERCARRRERRARRGVRSSARAATRASPTGPVRSQHLRRPSSLGTGIGRQLFEGVTRSLRARATPGDPLGARGGRPARRFYEKAGWSSDGAVSTHMFDCANEPVVRYAVDLFRALREGFQSSRSTLITSSSWRSPSYHV